MRLFKIVYSTKRIPGECSEMTKVDYVASDSMDSVVSHYSANKSVEYIHSVELISNNIVKFTS